MAASFRPTSLISRLRNSADTAEWTLVLFAPLLFGLSTELFDITTPEIQKGWVKVLGQSIVLMGVFTPLLTHWHIEYLRRKTVADLLDTWPKDINARMLRVKSGSWLQFYAVLRAVLAGGMIYFGLRYFFVEIPYHAPIWAFFSCFAFTLSMEFYFMSTRLRLPKPGAQMNRRRYRIARVVNFVIQIYILGICWPHLDYYADEFNSYTGPTKQEVMYLVLFLFLPCLAARLPYTWAIRMKGDTGKSGRFSRRLARTLLFGEAVLHLFFF